MKTARIAPLVLGLLSLVPLITRADEPPKSLDPRLKVELFAEHPQIVTPTGLDVDHRGRVFAIESNTHFPPDGYKGHSSDRVLVMSDSDGDGKADKITVFKDGLRHSMSVVVRPLWFPAEPMAESRKPKAEILSPETKKQEKDNGSRPSANSPRQSIYIATRREIIQLHDDDGDDKADREERIVHLDTKGDYPHNGLAGFAIDALGWMYFGFGENLGADYKIIGSDGATLMGGGEGGNIYRCRLDGSKLSHVATGFWNPHANCFDAFGRLFSVDNDPDSRPPCRLLHVIPGGDYGYRFRNGRKGLHPFTSWNGEIPGTLPMVAGTGEAPSGILAYESDGLPEEYLGNLLVTSWGDHRIDRFRLQPKGTSFTSLAEPLITGGENFRPVGIATAPDGSLFCTDWVLRDYKLHGSGRIWKISPKDARKTPVIDIAAISQRQTNELIELMKSPRREVRRSAARALAARPEADHQAVIPLWEKSGRFDLESLWALKSVRKYWNPEWVSADGDDPYETWRAMSPLRQQPAQKEVSFEQQQARIRGNVIRGLTRFFNRDAEASTATQSHNSKPNGTNPLWYDEAASLLPLIAQVGLDDTIIKLALSNDDPFIFATIVGMAHRQGIGGAKYFLPDATPEVKASPARVRQAMLLGSPGFSDAKELALSDSDPDVRRLAVQWVAEQKLVALKPRVEAIFDSKGMTPELFLATLAALEMLDGKNPADFDKTPAGQYMIPLLKDEGRSAAVRAQALRLVSPTDKALDAEFFSRLLKSDSEPLRSETIRTLQLASPNVSGDLLREFATNDQLDVQLRAESLVGLAAVAKTEPVGGPTRKLLKSFLNNNSLVPLRFEALRAARPLIANDPELRDGVLDIAKTLIKLADGEDATNLADQLALAFAEAKLDPPQSLKPNTNEKPKDRREWMDQLARGGNVDPAAGRRIFFHPNGPGCFKCHTIDGRGGKVGPDLSRAVGTMNRIQLIQSILEPSREIAPQYVAWTFETKEGKVVTGMVVHENEGKTIVGDAEGKLTELKTIDIETRTPQKISVMPDKLADRMTLQELRDLIAFLDTQR